MFNPKSHDSPRGKRGTVAAIVAVLMPALIGVTALGLDAGLLYLQRRQAQSAAEAISMAAAYRLYLSSTDTSGASAAASAMATKLGVSSSTVNIPPTTGIFANKSGYAQVTVTFSSPRLFSALWGSGSMSVSASAVSRSGGSQPYSTSGVILLDPSSSGALSVAGSGNITSSAPIQVDSSSATAVNVNNGGTINAPLNIVGNKTVAAGSSITGNVNIGAASVPDPLANLAAPSIPSATTTPLSSYQGWGSFTMQPGLYTGNVNLGNGGTFTMQPGTYYIQGGNFNIANGVTLSGTGVTIYIDNTNVPGTSSPGSISFQGGTTTNLTAPSSGPYAGLVYYQNRNSATSPQFGNGATINLTGTFYAPAAPLVFNGGTNNKLSTQLIGKSMNISNDAQITVPYSASTVASATGSFALVQ